MSRSWSVADDPTRAYGKAIDGARNVEELRGAIAPFRDIAADALEATGGDFDWREFRRGLRLERSGAFAGEAWAARYYVILMPEVMLRVQMVADHYCVPWGVAWRRLRQEGVIRDRGGVAVWVGASA